MADQKKINNSYSRSVGLHDRLVMSARLVGSASYRSRSVRSGKLASSRSVRAVGLIFCMSFDWTILEMLLFYSQLIILGGEGL